MDFRKVAAWFIISIMVLSIAGFIGGSLLAPPPQASQLTREFNGYTFDWENNQWVVTLAGQKYGFSYLPEEVQALPLPVAVAAWRDLEKVYLVQSATSSFYPGSSLNQLEAILAVNRVRLQKACLQGLQEELCPDIPLISCSTSSALIVESPSPLLNATVLTKNDLCLIVRAPSDVEFQKVTERIIYEFLGIMESSG